MPCPAADDASPPPADPTPRVAQAPAPPCFSASPRPPPTPRPAGPPRPAALPLMDADEEAEWIQAEKEEAAARAKEEEEAAASVNRKRARHEEDTQQANISEIFDVANVVADPGVRRPIDEYDCGKQFKGVSGRASGEETEKSFTEQLIEELKQREEEATEAQQEADVKLLEAKKLASQYQKEADKCSSGMDTCEEARERSADSLLGQKKLTALWEERARELGWKPGNVKQHQNR